VIFKAERWLFSHGLSRSSLIPILQVPVSCSFNPPVEYRADYAP
jgi:hypothetical protein